MPVHAACLGAASNGAARRALRGPVWCVCVPLCVCVCIASSFLLRVCLLVMQPLPETRRELSSSVLVTMVAAVGFVRVWQVCVAQHGAEHTCRSLHLGEQASALLMPMVMLCDAWLCVTSAGLAHACSHGMCVCGHGENGWCLRQHRCLCCRTASMGVLCGQHARTQSNSPIISCCWVVSCGCECC